MQHVEPTTTPPQLIIVPQNGGGGGFASRIGGAIIASAVISGVTYFSSNITLLARYWLTKEGAKVEMPAQTNGKADIATRAGNALDSTLAKIKGELNKTREATAGGVEKVQKTGAKAARKIEHKVDMAADEMKQLFAQRQEAARKKAEEDARQLAIERARYDEWADKFREYYNATCPNPRCRAPLRLQSSSATKTMLCVRCRQPFKPNMARALGRPEPPAFRSGHRSILGLFGQ